MANPNLILFYLVYAWMVERRNRSSLPTSVAVTALEAWSQRHVKIYFVLSQFSSSLQDLFFVVFRFSSLHKSY